MEEREKGILEMNGNIGLWGERHWFPWDIKRTYPEAKKKYNWPGESPFGGSPKRPNNIPEELMVGPIICNFKETSKKPNGCDYFQPYSKKFTEIAEGDVSRKSFKRLHRWRYSPAAAYGNNEVHLHPIFPRRLSVREALRIQTVPDNYALPQSISLSQKFKTIGNGVPVKLAEAMAISIKYVLRGDVWKHLT